MDSASDSFNPTYEEMVTYMESLIEEVENDLFDMAFSGQSAELKKVLTELNKELVGIKHLRFDMMRELVKHVFTFFTTF